jgi:hypothetical protein
MCVYVLNVLQMLYAGNWMYLCSTCLHYLHTFSTSVYLHVPHIACLRLPSSSLCMYMCVCLCLHVCVCVRIWVCLSVCVHACMHACLFVRWGFSCLFLFCFAAIASYWCDLMLTSYGCVLVYLLTRSPTPTRTNTASTLLTHMQGQRLEEKRIFWACARRRFCRRR